MEPVFVHNDDAEWVDEGSDYPANNKEWEKMRNVCTTEGYKEGIAAGEQAKLQEAFNMGYKKGVYATVNIARMRGLLNAILFSVRTGILKPAGKDLDRWMKEVDDVIVSLKQAEAMVVKDSACDNNMESVDLLAIHKSCVRLLNEMDVEVPHDVIGAFLLQ